MIIMPLTRLSAPGLGATPGGGAFPVEALELSLVQLKASKHSTDFQAWNFRMEWVEAPPHFTVYHGNYKKATPLRVLMGAVAWNLLWL